MTAVTHFTTNPQKLRAHAVLDDVKAGLYHPLQAIRWALRVLGEPVDACPTTTPTSRSSSHGC